MNKRVIAAKMKFNMYLLSAALGVIAAVALVLLLVLRYGRAGALLAVVIAVIMAFPVVWYLVRGIRGLRLPKELIVCENGTLTVQDVDAVVYRDTDYKIYEMTEALGKGNAAKYLSVLAELTEKGMDEGGILNALVSYFRTLTEVSLLRSSDADAAAALGMKEYAVKMNRRQANALGKKRVAEAYRRIFALQSAVRSGKCTPQGALLSVNARLLFGDAQEKEILFTE